MVIIFYLFAKDKITIANIAEISPIILREVAFSSKARKPINDDNRTTDTFVTAKTVESCHPVVR
jgi:hypothetical protein